MTAAGLEAEVSRLSRRGRTGTGALRDALRRRGIAGVVAPSVLESRVLRLLRSWGIEPLRVESTVLGGRYRSDFLLRPTLALEVDGYTYHWSPEAKAADSRRRNDLRLAGFEIIETDWVTAVRQPGVLRREVPAAMASWDARHRGAGAS
ncbi:MAG TPA: hypothetical protein VKV25_08625 [Acidimicrobiales bacterium]|nr:hypothetical protein [Acidimicrobiales bacterium]